MTRFAACCLLLALAACGGPAQKPATGGAAPPAKPAAQTAPQGEQAQQAQQVRTVAPKQSAAVPPQPPETAEPTVPEIPIDDDPAQFMGAGDADLRDALGAPFLVRRDGPAEVWQFRGDTCTLDLFLYPGADEALAVKHVELRGDGTEAERRACLADVIRAHIVAADG